MTWRVGRGGDIPYRNAGGKCRSASDQVPEHQAPWGGPSEEPCVSCASCAEGLRMNPRAPRGWRGGDSGGTKRWTRELEAVVATSSGAHLGGRGAAKAWSDPGLMVASPAERPADGPVL